LLENGLDINEMNRKLKIDHRIEMEETVLKSADRVITSTRQEIEGQYGLYRNRTLPVYKVLPPGIGIEKFHPYYHDTFSNSREREEALYAKASVTQELNRFFTHPDKPIILVLCRPDKRKNIQGLVKAYGEDVELQAMANLAIFAGIRKDISQKEESERDVLTRMLLLMDKYNLYGKMAIPKQHDFEHEVPELYRIAAEQRGVFVNPALTEPFGLTLLEALACGLPIVSTNDGGPRDIVENCKTGTLVDPTDTVALASAIKDIIVHPDKWHKFSKNGILNTRKMYSWERHAHAYCDEMKALCHQYGKILIPDSEPKQSVGKRLAKLDYMLIADIDDTLLGGTPEELQTLMDLLERHSGQIGFGVATGRIFESAMDILTLNGVRLPDIIISGVGSRISYGGSLDHDKGWRTHISKSWNPDLIASRLEKLDFVRLQKASVQGPFKLSYYMDPGKDRLAKIHHILTQNRFRYSLIYSRNRYLDILPYRASKGKAIRYLSYKWGIPLKNLLVCGDSGNDAEMLKGETLGVVVGNYSPELETLRSAKQIYFAKRNHVGGMMEGMQHYQLIQKATGGVNHDN
jgi:sucrose-phosphate synthase